ncbi:MAG TPA: nucleoside hydrolase [Spirochaetota bacterium]|nr:nucleoside hydrolase [Spirochaetota bacterium]
MFSGELIKPRMRVILSNDFGGDPDGLVQLAHHVLSPSVEISGIIGSFFTRGTFFNADPSAANACRCVEELLSAAGLSGQYAVYQGADAPMRDMKTPVKSPGAEFIVREAMRTDTDLPLFVLCGASLTDIASAFILEPSIAERLTLVWIGGPEYSEHARRLSGCPALEYNMGIDIVSAKVIFNKSSIPLWQVPRDAYRQVIMSYAEILHRVRPCGVLGAYISDRIDDAIRLAASCGLNLGETYIMGDSPLVLLSSLQSAFDRDPSSSVFVEHTAPLITDGGMYEENVSGRDIRVYTSLDCRLLLEDFYAKLALV